MYEATDEGITSFRKVSKSKSITADASSDRGAVGMHITHSTRTTDEGDTVNVHRCAKPRLYIPTSSQYAP